MKAHFAISDSSTAIVKIFSVFFDYTETAMKKKKFNRLRKRINKRDCTATYIFRQTFQNLYRHSQQSSLSSKEAANFI